MVGGQQINIEFSGGSRVEVRGGCTNGYQGLFRSLREGGLQGRIQDFFVGGGRTQKWGQFGPCGPQLGPSTGHIGPGILVLCAPSCAQFGAKISTFHDQNEEFSHK